ncbi:SCL-interrupting locus protein homolog isoform X2 [Ptychodera flava]|uniref:SCL-interrupting locus protein homolog isoform X2 n=1 Tax=Ptychodera flava TaxID=63121 RepID=UPI00396A46A2
MSLAVNLNKLPAYVKDSAYFQQQKQEDKVKKSPNGTVPLQFPITRNILWNRSPTGPSSSIHLTQKRGIGVHILEKALQLAHRHAKQTGRSLYNCFLIASVNSNSGDGVTVSVDRFDPGRDLPGRPGRVPTAQLPGDQIIPLTTTLNPHCLTSSSIEHYIAAFKLLQHHCSSKDSIDINRFICLKVFCCCYDNDNDVTFNLQVIGITMATKFDVTPINPIPIIPTALARNLTGPLSLSEVQGIPKSGYITMDQTRKLLLLLESDPKVYNLPLVGVWLSGVTSTDNPYVWASCLRYMFNSSIQERVCGATQGFLLVLYTPTHTNPEFYECKAKEDKLGFQLHTCEENLHMFKHSDCMSRPPTQLELQPAKDGLHQSIFMQAVKEMPQIETSPALPPEIQLQRMFPGSANNSMEEETEANSSLPRPSPSPHPLADKSPSIKPSVPELSFIFDESFMEHLPVHTNNHSTPTKDTGNSRRLQSDIMSQENSPYQQNRMKNQAVMSGQTTMKQLSGSMDIRNGRPGPLRPLNVDLNNCNGATTPNPSLVSNQGRNQRGMSPRAVTPNRPPRPMNQISHQQRPTGPVPMNYHPQPRPQSSNYPPQQTQQFVSYQRQAPNPNNRPLQQPQPYQQQMNYRPVAPNYNGSQGYNGYRPPVNPRMQTTRFSPPQRRLTPPRGRPPTPTILSNGEVWMPNIQNQKPIQQVPVQAFQGQASPPNYQTNGNKNGQWVGHTTTPRRASLSTDSTLSPDAYQLLMDQDKQLKLLQSQIQLLLKAQEKYDSNSGISNPSLNTLTPPTSPGMTPPDSKHIVPTQRPTRTMDIATSPMNFQSKYTTTAIATNTGPSLLMSPVAPRVNMDGNPSEISSCCSSQITSKMFDMSGTFALPNAQEHTESVMSPIVAVDLQSFTDSSVQQRMNGSLTGSNILNDSRLQTPVLGESVSMHIEQQRQKEKEQQMMNCSTDKVNCENSLLAKDEKKFYQQVLGQVNQFLKGSPEKLNESQQSENTNENESSHEKSDIESTVELKTPDKSDQSKLGMSFDDSEFIPTKGSPETIRFSPVIGDYIPRINYTSMNEMTMDGSDLSFEANAIAMKYLSDKQLTKLSHHMGQQRQATPQEKLLQTVLTKAASDKTLLGSSVYDSSPVNMSLASKKYLEKYGLLDKSGNYSTIKEVSICQRCGEEVNNSPQHRRICYSPPSRDTSCRTPSTTPEPCLQCQLPCEHNTSSGPCSQCQPSCTHRVLSFSQTSSKTSSSQSSSNTNGNVLNLKKIRDMPKLL